MKIFSAAQVKEWDAYTVQHESITSWQLMEHASYQCTKWLFENNKINQPLKIFCGKGNNGGDGLAIACQLAERNIIAEIFILESGATGTAEFHQNLSRIHDFPNEVRFIHEESSFPSLGKDDVLIDALYGSGVNRPLQGLSVALVANINHSQSHVISIDVPSGMFVDQSTSPYACIRADITLTFQCLKLCFLLPENELFFGRVQVLPIDLSAQFEKENTAVYEVVEKGTIQNIYKPRKNFSHKGTFGHSLIVAGNKGRMGAAILSSKACLRSGAGLVTVLLRKEHVSIMQVAVPEAMVMLRSKHAAVEKYACIGIGPGLGTGNAAVNMLKLTLANTKTPIVIDADALNILAENKELVDDIPQHSILTPHPKEFDRLFGEQANDFARLQKAIEESALLKIYIVLKGHRTAIACPNGKVFFNSTGNPGMATAGSGDVLTGLLTGLLSQGYSSEEASIFGVYLHGLAGDIAAAVRSQEALIASDIIESFGEAFKKIIV